jgi:hypothetical protein
MSNSITLCFVAVFNRIVVAVISGISVRAGKMDLFAYHDVGRNKYCLVNRDGLSTNQAVPVILGSGLAVAITCFYFSPR